MNAQELKEELLKELPIGSNYDIWEIGRKAQRIVEIATGKHLSWTEDKHTVKISYQGWSVVDIKVQRKKGKCKNNYWNSYATHFEWSIAGYELTLCKNTIEERIEEIKNNLIVCENHRVEQINKNVEFTKKLMSLGFTLKEIKDYVQYMDSWTHRHEVFDKIEKGE